MLRFNKTIQTVEKASESISIHPMLRFNKMLLYLQGGIMKFQYILCYGSTLSLSLFFRWINNFNTSYVTVQRSRLYFFFMSLEYFNTSYVTVQRRFKRNCKCINGISIHPMLRFN